MRADLKHVASNATQMNAEEITQLLRLLEYFEDLFDGNLGDWDTDPDDLDIKPGYKPFNSKYDPFHRINKDNFRKELKRLADIGFLTLVQ